MPASTRPIVAQYRTSAASVTTSSAVATVCSRSGLSTPGLNANAAPISSAAVPALNLKNLTPASRPTHASTNVMPTPRWARNRKRMDGKDTTGVLGSQFSVPERRTQNRDRERKNLTFAESRSDFRPVHRVPPGGEIVGAAVLIEQVVGVLPDVDAEDRRSSRP